MIVRILGILGRVTSLVVAFAVIGTAVPAEAAEFEGLQRVDPKLLHDVVDDLDVDASEDAMAIAIRRLYALEYFEWIQVHRREGELIWVVKERPFVTAIEHQGIEVLSDEDVEKTISIETNSFLDPVEVRKTRRALQDKYREEGYAETEVVVRTESAGETGEVTVIVEAREIGKVRINEVRIDGNKQVPDAELKARLQSRPPNGISFLSSQGDFERSAAETDKFRLEGAYLEQGYLKVQVAGPDVSYLPDERSVIIEYQVQEGLQYNLGELDFTGDLFFRDETLEKFIGLTPGEPLNRVQLEQGVQQIVEAYTDFGFAFARVVPEFTFDDDNRIAHVSIEITRGPLVYVRNIRISGNTKTRDKVIRRELTIVEGEMFSGGKVRQSRERVFALGFFENVTFETNAVGEDTLDIHIKVAERPTGTASAGLGFSSVDKFVGNLGLNFGNLMGYGVRFDLKVEFGGNLRSFSASYSDPYLLDTPLSLQVDAYSTRQFINSGRGVQSYTQRNLGGSVSLGYKLALYTRYILTFRDELIRYSDVAFRSQRFFINGETRSLTHAIRRDSRNHPYDPQRGNLSMVSVENAGRWLGADNDFTKYRFLTQQFFTIFKHLTFMLRGEIGMATTRGGTVPFAERYFLGGIHSLRGYQFRQVGPSLLVSSNTTDPNAEIVRAFVGGNKQVYFNNELIFPLIPPAGIKGVVFFDAGNTWLEEDAFFDSALRLGYGIGFRWFSPIGPLRFEWGFPINKRENERSRVFEFSIGTFF